MKTRHLSLGASALAISAAPVVVAEASAPPTTTQASVGHVSPGRPTCHINSVAMSGDGVEE